MSEDRSNLSTDGLAQIVAGLLDPCFKIERHKTTTGSEIVQATIDGRSFNITITKARRQS